MSTIEVFEWINKEKAKCRESLKTVQDEQVFAEILTKLQSLKALEKELQEFVREAA